MRDVSIEDVQSETASSSLPLKKRKKSKPPHHLPPSSLARIRQVDRHRVQTEMVVEDVTAKDLKGLKQYEDNDLLKEEPSQEPVADKEEDSDIRYLPHLTSPDRVPVNNDTVPERTLKHFRIALDFEHVDVVVTHTMLTDCDVFDTTLGFKIYDDFEFAQSDTKILDSNQDPILVDKIVKREFCDGCELQNMESNFRIPSELEFHQSSVDFKISPELDINTKSSKFWLHEGMDWRVPRKVNVVGNTECSRSANRPTFSIPTTENVEIKNHSKFILPKYRSSDEKMKSSDKFFVPDYSTYKKSEVNGKKNRRFHIFQEPNMDKNKPCFSIPKGPSFGWGFKFISIPVTPSGPRSKCAKFYITEDANVPDAKPIFKIPSLDKDDDEEKTKADRFFLPESGNLSNITRQFTICDGLELVKLEPSIVRDSTKDSILVNEVKNIFISDCTLENINLDYKFNELEIDCSQISLE